MQQYLQEIILFHIYITIAAQFFLLSVSLTMAIKTSANFYATQATFSIQICMNE